MSGISQAYHIGGPTRRCSATGRALSVGEPFVAALAESPDDGGLVRLDFAEEAWLAGSRPEPPLRLFGSWRSRVPEPTAKPQPLMGDDEVLELFEQLGEEDAPARRGFRYLLGLILMRRKVLMYAGGTPADAKRGIESEILLRRRGKAHEHDEPYRVADPGLDEAALSEATEEIGRVLQLEDEEAA